MSNLSQPPRGYRADEMDQKELAGWFTKLWLWCNQTLATLLAHIAATIAHGATGAVMGTTNSQTVSNKVMDSTNKYGGVSNYSAFEADGTLVATGDATGWDDIDFPLIPKTTGVGAPSYQTVVGNLQSLAFAVNDALLLEAVEQRHTVKTASTATWHVHVVTMVQDGTDRGVKIELEYSAANVLQAGGVTAFPTPTTVSAELTIPANTPIHTHMILDIATFTTLLPMSHIMCRVKRIASVGTAPSVNPCIINVQYHAEIDTPAGSRQITTK